MTLKILQVAHGFPPHEQAGAELHCYFLARELLGRGHRVEVFSRREDRSRSVGEVTCEPHEGIAVTRINRPLDRLESLSDGSWSGEVEVAFRRKLAEGFDVVHFHHLLGLSAGLVGAAKDAGAVVLFTLHDFWFLCPRGQMFTPGAGGGLCTKIDPIKCSRCLAKKRARWALNALTANWRGLANPLRALVRGWRYLRGNLHTAPLRARLEDMVTAINQADLILSPSQFLLDVYQRYGVSREKSRWHENGMGDSWAADLTGREAAGKPLRFGFIGSFIHSKGVDVLIRAWQEMPPGKAELHLHGTSLWDDGAYAAALAESNAHPDVHFHGAFPHGDLPGIMAPLDVLVVPSRWYENAPLTIDEASLARIPVITTGHGGMAEVVERRKNGLLFKPDDDTDLRRAILRFVEEPDLWEELREPAVPVRSMAEQTEKLEGLMLKLVR